MAKHWENSGEMVFYESARDELIQRLNLRDQALIAYILAAGTYFGLVIGIDRPTPTLNDIVASGLTVLVLPVLSLAFTYIILQHHVMIGRIGQFNRARFEKSLQWDGVYYLSPDKSYLAARNISQGILLVIPTIYVATFSIKLLYVTRGHAVQMSIGLLTLLIDMLILVAIGRAHFWAHRARRETDNPPEADGVQDLHSPTSHNPS